MQQKGKYVKTVETYQKSIHLVKVQPRPLLKTRRTEKQESPQTAKRDRSLPPVQRFCSKGNRGVSYLQLFRFQKSDRRDCDEGSGLP